MKLLNQLAVAVISLIAATLVSAEPNDGGAIAHKPTLTLAGAKQALAAAEAFARQHGATPSIAIVDEGGHLIAFSRPETGFVAGANVSIGKARTAAIFKKPTKDFEDLINQGRFTMTALPDFTPLQGGVPIKVGDQVVGAIGVSGAKSALQDEEVALAGARALAETKLTKAE